jgi:hypothetical protein
VVLCLALGASRAPGQEAAPREPEATIQLLQVPVTPRPAPPPTLPSPVLTMSLAPADRPPDVPDVVPAAAAVPPEAPGRSTLAGIPAGMAPELLGDSPPLSLIVPTPAGPVVIPRPRGFKIDDNESPAPQDRAYFTFNTFNNLYRPINQRFGTDFGSINVQRETFGVEKAFFDHQVSFGVRFPINTVTAPADLPGLGGSHTSMGDLSFITKVVLWQDSGPADPGSELGEALQDLLGSTPDPTWFRLVSAGLAVTAPTGADSLFGDGRFGSFHTTTLTPYLGAIWKRGSWYVQGFTSADIPTDPNDVTMLYKDLSVRYFLYQTPSSTLVLTAIVPVVELHVNTPLNHRGILHTLDPAGTPDVVDVTAGVDLCFFDWARLAFGFVTPLTGPRLQDYEVLGQLKMLF